MVRVGQVYRLESIFAKALFLEILEIRPKEVLTNCWYVTKPTDIQRTVSGLSYFKGLIQMGRCKLVKPKLKLTLSRIHD